MTSIGFRAPGTFVPPVQPTTAARPAAVRRPAVAPPPATWARLGRVEMHSALRYLTVWAAVMFVVVLAVEVVTYVFLAALGVLSSVSSALALVNDQSGSGLVPMLQPQHVLPMLVVMSLLISGLFLLGAVGVLLVHNATTALTGGLRVRVRPEQPRRHLG